MDPALYTLQNLLQVLVLSGGALLMLSFLRTARGTGMLRGMAVTLVGGGFSLWGLAWYFELAELQHVLRAILEVAVIVLAILFHPELRRGIMSLGDNRLLRRFLAPDRKDVIEEVSEAAISMAKRREGALIAFERQQPLDAIVERGVRVDSEVRRLLLENLFHHGAPLHDGGVVLRGDRIAAAACIFPLSESRDISKSTGTRHRAAIGLTEESDAVTVTVSEETGAIAVCKEGQLDRVARDDLATVLRERLGDIAPSDAPSGGWFTGLLRATVARPVEKLAALALGTLIFFTAWSAVRTEESFDLDLRVVAEGSNQDLLVPGSLTIVVPDDVALNVTDRTGSTRKALLNVDAERETINRLKAKGLGALMTIQSGETGDRTISIDELSWGLGEQRYDGELHVTWRGQEPLLELTRLETVSLAPTMDQVRLVLDNVAGGRVARTEMAAFYPTEVTLRGPQASLDSLDRGLLFRDVKLPRRDAAAWAAEPRYSSELLLTEDLLEEGIELLTEVRLDIPVHPVPITIGEVEVDVTLQSLDPEDPDAASRYQPPDKRVTLEVLLIGVPLGDEQATLVVRLRDLVRNHARAWVDVSDVDPDEARGRVRVKGIPREAWLQELPDTITDLVADATDVELRVTVREGDRELLLVPVENGENGEDP
jgi:diadenylate cyclase